MCPSSPDPRRIATCGAARKQTECLLTEVPPDAPEGQGIPWVDPLRTILKLEHMADGAIDLVGSQFHKPRFQQRDPL
jgi:hypothetical protein